jgi:hypothetical protein
LKGFAQDDRSEQEEILQQENILYFQIAIVSHAHTKKMPRLFRVRAFFKRNYIRFFFAAFRFAGRFTARFFVAFLAARFFFAIAM